jgi:hypothetical protein
MANLFDAVIATTLRATAAILSLLLLEFVSAFPV